MQQSSYIHHCIPAPPGNNSCNTNQQRNGEISTEFWPIKYRSLITTRVPRRQVKGRKSSTGTTKATPAAQGVPSEEEASGRVAPVKTQAGDIRSRGGGGGDGQHDSTLPRLSLVDHASTGGSGASKVTKQATAAAAAQGEGGPGEKAVAPFSAPNPNEAEPHQRGEDGASRVNDLEPDSAITRAQRHHAEAPRVGFGGEKSGRDSDGQTELGEFTTPEMLKGGDVAKKAGGAKVRRRTSFADVWRYLVVSWLTAKRSVVSTPRPKRLLSSWCMLMPIHRSKPSEVHKAASLGHESLRSEKRRSKGAV